MDTALQWGESAAGELLRASWQIALLIVLIGVVALLCRTSSPNVRYWLWCLVLVRLCLPLELRLPVGLSDAVAGWFRTAPAVVVQRLTMDEPPPPDLFPRVSPEPATVTRPLPSPVTSAAVPKPTLPPLPALAVFAWLAGIMIMFALVIRRMISAARFLRTVTPVNRPGLAQLMIRLTRLMGIRRPVAVHAADNLAGPAVIGLFRPAIILPASIADRWNDVELEPVLLHELAHIKRRDNLVNFLQSLLQIVWFFHPLVWLVNRHIRRLREDACDDLAISYLNVDRRMYSEQLVRMVEETDLPAHTPLAAVGFAENGHALLHRVTRIMHRSYRRYVPIRKSARIALAALAVTLVIASASGIPVQKPVEFIAGVQSLDTIIQQIRESGKIGWLYFEPADPAIQGTIDHDIFANPRIAALAAESFVIFRIPVTAPFLPELQKQCALLGIPGMLLMDCNGARLDVHNGYNWHAGEIETTLQRVSFRTADTNELLKQYEANSDNPEALWNYAEHLYHGIRYRDALPLLQELTVKEPKDPDKVAAVWTQLSHCFLEIKQYDQLIQTLETGLAKGKITGKEPLLSAYTKLTFWTYRLGYHDKTLLYTPLLEKQLSEFLNVSVLEVNDPQRTVQYAKIARLCAASIAAQRGDPSKADALLTEVLQPALDGGDYETIGLMISSFVSFDLMLDQVYTRLKNYILSLNDRSKQRMYGYWLVEIQKKQGKFDDLITEKTQELAQGVGGREQFAIRSDIAAFHVLAGRKETGLVLFEALVQEAGNDYGRWRTLVKSCCMHRIPLEQVPSWSERCITLSRERGDSGLLVNDLLVHGEALYIAGKTNQALLALDQARQVVENSTIQRVRRFYSVIDQRKTLYEQGLIW